MTKDFFKSDTLYSILVKPNSSKNSHRINGNNIIITLTAKPIDNEANKALVKYFKKEFNLSIEIIKGYNTRHKVIRLK